MPLGNRRFAERLEKSDRPVRIMRRWAAWQYCDAWLLPLKFMQEGDRLEDFQDDGDLLIKGLRTDVKGLSCHFTGRADWPFPNFIVMERAPWERANPKPAWVISMSADFNHIGRVGSESSARWRVHKKRDRVYGEDRVFMFAPLDCVSWYRIPDEINRD